MQQAARTYYHTCPTCKSNLDPGERCACQSVEHRRQEFRNQMDKRMEEYRKAGVPFIGYLWVNWRTGREGGALYRLDEVEVQNELRIREERLKLGQKIQIKKPGLQAVMRVIKQLERELGTQVYTYLG